MENFRNTLRETIDSGDYEGFLRTIDFLIAEEDAEEV